MIKIKRIYESPSSNDGKRVLVDRLWPRGIGKDRAKIDEWLKDIAPSAALRKWFGHDPARWQAFRERYEKELDANADLVAHLRREARRGSMTLLFSAKDGEHNNAIVLKKVIERRS